MKGSEIARMSHMLRGRLQSAPLNLQCAAVQHQGDAATQELVGVVRQELLDESRMLVAAFEVLSRDIARLQRVNLGFLVRQALRVYRRRHVIVADLDWPEVTGDIQLLSLAVAHLVWNACEATPAGWSSSRDRDCGSAQGTDRRARPRLGSRIRPAQSSLQFQAPEPRRDGTLDGAADRPAARRSSVVQSFHHGTQVRLALPARPFLFTLRAGRRAPRSASRA